MCDSPCTIHSASDFPTPGPSLTHTAAADHSPFTSGVSPRIGIPSGVSEMRPLIAYFTPTDSSPTISGIRSSASASWGSKSACVNGNSVGESAAASIDGISSGSWTIERCAYEPISRPVPSCRSYMKTSMSRTIGNSIALELFSKRGTGPMSIIWCTIGVSGMCAPAIAARSGLQTPQAITIVSASIVPRDVCDASDPAVHDVHPGHLGVRKHRQRARLDRALAHQRPGPERVDDRHGRAVEPSEQDRLVDVRDELGDLGRRHEPCRVDAPGLR